MHWCIYMQSINCCWSTYCSLNGTHTNTYVETVSTDFWKQIILYWAFSESFHWPAMARSRSWNEVVLTQSVTVWHFSQDGSSDLKIFHQNIYNEHKYFLYYNHNCLRYLFNSNNTMIVWQWWIFKLVWLLHLGSYIFSVLLTIAPNG